MCYRKMPPGGRPGDGAKASFFPFSTMFAGAEGGGHLRRSSAALAPASPPLPNKDEIPCPATVDCARTRSPFESVNLDSTFLQGFGSFSSFSSSLFLLSLTSESVAGLVTFTPNSSATLTQEGRSPM